MRLERPLVPFGGGSSVVGGVTPDIDDIFAGTVTLDMSRMNRVLEVDPVSRAARIQGGARGPELEAGLKPHGMTLRHFPQSFQHSTLGGWIATRSGGHFATLYTHIDDLVESVSLVTPAGRMESRRLPGSGAGPSPDRLVLGSEGALGIITEAWVRLQGRVAFKATAGFRFADFLQAAGAVRAIAQAGLFPSQRTDCRRSGTGRERRRRRFLHAAGGFLRIGRPPGGALVGPSRGVRSRITAACPTSTGEPTRTPT